MLYRYQFIFLITLPFFFISCKEKEGDQKYPRSKQAVTLLATEENGSRRRSSFALVGETDEEFCWKDTETRGVGTVPKKCESGEEMIGLLCYDECAEGESRFGFDCHSDCPDEDGWSDDGLFCRRYEYGRGAGYALWDYQKCLDENEYGCAQEGALYYPNCAPGYSPFGCCICRPDNFSCDDYGLGAQLDLSCGKNITIGSPGIGICEDDEDLDAGLCYPTCGDAYQGIGPVCWAEEPPFENWVDCGMGFAKDDVTCGFIITDQVLAVADMAISLASMGTAAGVTSGITSAVRATSEVISTATTISSTMQAMYEVASGNVSELDGFALDSTGNLLNAAGSILIGVDDIGDFLTTTVDTIDNLETGIADENQDAIIDAAIDVASLFDPTGITGVISAYNYPICSDVENAYTEEVLVEVEEASESSSTSSDKKSRTNSTNTSATETSTTSTKETLGKAVNGDKVSLEDPEQKVSICISNKDSESSKDLCLIAGKSNAKFGAPITLGESYSESKNLFNATFLVSPIVKDSDLYTICLSGQKEKDDSEKSLCLRAEKTQNDELALTLKGTQEQNRSHPYGSFQIKKNKTDEPYLSLCLGSSSSDTLTAGDLCWSPQEGLEPGSPVSIKAYKQERKDTSQVRLTKKDIKKLGKNKGEEIEIEQFLEEPIYFIFK